MFSPEEQQIEICLLKSNLEEIENDLVVQRSALPALDAENEQKYRETMTALQIARTLNAEIERLKQENVRLTAKRMQLKRQCEDISKALEKARDNRNELEESLTKEEQEIEQEIRKYEDLLREKADRFRRTRTYYNENEMSIEMEKINNVIVKLENDVEEKNHILNELKEEFDTLNPFIPEDILTIIGKNVLDTKVKELTDKCEALHVKRDCLINNRRVAYQPVKYNK